MKHTSCQVASSPSSCVNWHSPGPGFSSVNVPVTLPPKLGRGFDCRWNLFCSAKLASNSCRWWSGTGGITLQRICCYDCPSFMTKHTTCLTTEETNNTCDVKHAKRRLACSVCLTRVCVCVCVSFLFLKIFVTWNGHLELKHRKSHAQLWTTKKHPHGPRSCGMRLPFFKIECLSVRLLHTS